MNEKVQQAIEEMKERLESYMRQCDPLEEPDLSKLTRGQLISGLYHCASKLEESLLYIEEVLSE